MPAEHIERRILLLRGQKVMLDFHLAELYEVETKALNQAVKRNNERFPEDFMFQLTEEEARELSRSQIVTLNLDSDGNPLADNELLRSQIVTLKRGQHLKYLPYAFTEQGVAMLSSVLRSPRAVAVNIAVIRTFVKLRQMLTENTELARRLDALERKFDTQFKVVFDTIRELMKPITPAEARREIGFHTLMPKRTPKSRARTKAKVST
ncbi:MAG: ORF6N domain-containing protein [Verrucomicrobia bacterium]|nr:ORF6N domain-containing protein [Verrucomicrobiota bacterium]